jgi:peptide/nickel transport system permease protein
VWRFVLKRLAGGLATLLAVSVLVFAAVQVLPGDVAQVILGRDATPQSLAVVRERLHLDDSLTAQYLAWLKGVVQGDLGMSLAGASTGLSDQGTHEGTSVASVVATPLRNTLALVLATTVLLVPLSLFLGTFSARYRDRAPDRVIGVATLSVISVPDFVVAVALILLLSLAVPLVPAVSVLDPSRSPLAQIDVLVLPVLTLLAAMLAQTTRMVRAGVLQVMEADYVHMARLRGVAEPVVWRRYVLRNALAASVQVFAINIAWMFGGIIVVESVFQYPGIGLQLVQSLSARDLPVVEAIALIIAAAYVLINLAADVLTVLLTPKLRAEL